MTAAAFDVCVLGHVTRDVIRDSAGTRTQPGGAAYYGAAALAQLGLRARLVTRLAGADAALLDGLRELGVAIAVKESAETTVFEVIPGEVPGQRTYRALSVADAFRPGDLEGVRADAILMDPLTTHEGFAAFMEAASAAAPRVALDVQGFVRKFLMPPVSEALVAGAMAGLEHAAIVKADAAEAAAITGESGAAAARALAALGVREVLVTRGGEGSLVFAQGRAHDIPAFAPKHLVDPTGAGDSYLAGYLAARLAGEGPREAGRFGAAVATLKLARSGAFAASRADVARLLARQGG